MSEIWRPKDFQEQGRLFLNDTPAAALWWRMGRGKTVTTATAMADLIDIGMARRGLVVAPVRVMSQTWPNEFKKWAHLNGLKYQVIRGTPKQRRAQALAKADIHLINWESLHWLVDEFKGQWPWDLVTLDEASKVKNQGSRTYQVTKEIRPEIKRIIELTGSPATNGLKNVWAPMYILDRGRRLGRTEESFRNRWFFTDRAGTTHIRGKVAEDDIHDRIHDVVYALRSAVTGNEPIFNRVHVQLPGNVMQQYRRLENQAFLELDNGKTIEPFNAAAVTGKLLQFASGAVYTEHPAWTEVDRTKLDTLADIVDDAMGRPMIVAYNSRHECERIMARFPQAVHIEQLGDQVEERWNSGNIPMLVMHPQSGGHGLNLQFGGSTVVWFSLTWNLEHFEQLIARLHGRHGQLDDVIVHMMIAMGTLDEEVDLRLVEKASVQEALMIAAERRRRSK